MAKANNLRKLEAEGGFGKGNIINTADNSLGPKIVQASSAVTLRSTPSSDLTGIVGVSVDIEKAYSLGYFLGQPIKLGIIGKAAYGAINLIYGNALDVADEYTNF